MTLPVIYKRPCHLNQFLNFAFITYGGGKENYIQTNTPATKRHVTQSGTCLFGIKFTLKTIGFIQKEVT